MKPAGAEPLGDTNARAAIAYLARAPYENVFLNWLIERDPWIDTRAATYVYASGGTVCGVAYFGRQIVIAAEGDDAVAAFAAIAPSYPQERMIVGRRETVARYWKIVRGCHVPARIVRDEQPLLMVDRETLRGASGGVLVRRATPAEWEAVARNSARMIQAELEYDPRAYGSAFDANVRRMIEAGLWWVGEYAGDLCFFCNAGPHSDRTLQLQGIWVPPALRGHGLASAALFGVCERLLENVPTISLYVNGFNVRALALYERTGFTRVGAFTTLLF